MTVVAAALEEEEVARLCHLGKAMHFVVFDFVERPWVAEIHIQRVADEVGKAHCLVAETVAEEIVQFQSENAVRVDHSRAGLEQMEVAEERYDVGVVSDNPVDRKVVVDCRGIAAAAVHMVENQVAAAAVTGKIRSSRRWSSDSRMDLDFVTSLDSACHLLRPLV